MPTSCPKCGPPLVSEKQAGKCDVCGRECEVHECRNGHLPCDGCADELVFEKVIDYCLRSESDQLLPGQIGASEGLVPAGVDDISDGL